MSIFDKITGKKNSGDLEESFYDMIEKHKKGPDKIRIGIFRKDEGANTVRGRGSFVTEIPLKEFLKETKDGSSVNEYLKDEYKNGGQYTIEFREADGTKNILLNDFKFAIDGPPKTYGNGSNGGGGDVTKAVLEGFVAAIAAKDQMMMQVLSTVLAKDGNGAVKEIMELYKSQQQMTMELLLSGRDSADPLDQFQKFIQIQQALQPKINEGDSTNAMIAQLGAPIVGALASKWFGVPQAEAQPLAEAPLPNQQIQPQQIQQIQQARQPEIIQPEPQPNQPQSSDNISLSGTPPKDNPLLTDQVDQSDEEENQTHIAFEVMCLAPFQKAIEDKVEVIKLAAYLAKMIEDISIWTPNDPHPMIADLFGGIRDMDVAKMDSGFNSFAKDIGMDDVTAKAVKDELIKLYKDAFTAKTEEAEKSP